MSNTSHLVFARKYRPQLFQDVIHQNVAIGALTNALKQNRIGHAYIFFGPRGVGKTTIARILAKRLNCENPKDIEPCNECKSCQEITRGVSSDVLEIDAASNRGIDNIRDLRENVKFSPMGGRHKIYIIDEVHMLTEASFNALLKTLEEPPPHVVFILATTEYHKIPETILSRCQDFIFKKVPLAELQNYVEHLSKIENIKYDSEGLFWIAKKGDGSVRDTLSFMEQAVTFTNGVLTGSEIANMIGYRGVEEQIDFLRALLKENSSTKILGLIENLFLDGTDLFKFLWDFVEFSHSLVMIKERVGERDSFNYPVEDIEKIRKEIQDFSPEVLSIISNYIFHAYERLSWMRLKNSFEMKVFLQIEFRKLIEDLNKPSVSGLLEKITKLSEMVQKSASGGKQESMTTNSKNSKLTTGPSSMKEDQDIESVIKKQFSATETPDQFPDIK